MIFSIIRGLFYAALISAGLYLFASSFVAFALLDPSYFVVTNWHTVGRVLFGIVFTVISILSCVESFDCWLSAKREKERKLREEIEKENEARRALSTPNFEAYAGKYYYSSF